MKPPQSKRWRARLRASDLAKRLDCGGFSAAFPVSTQGLVGFVWRGLVFPRSAR
jgi:hypothetical protein